MWTGDDISSHRGITRLSTTLPYFFVRGVHPIQRVYSTVYSRALVKCHVMQSSMLEMLCDNT